MQSLLVLAQHRPVQLLLGVVLEGEYVSDIKDFLGPAVPPGLAVARFCTAQLDLLLKVECPEVAVVELEGTCKVVVGVEDR